MDAAPKAVESGCQEIPHSKNGFLKPTGEEGSAIRIADDCDPISDFTPQLGEPVASPPRVRKRSFAHAMLEEASQCDGTAEDDLRRKQGPPRTSHVAHGDEVVCSLRDDGEHPAPEMPAQGAGDSEGVQNPKVDKLSPTSTERTKASQQPESETHLNAPGPM